MFDSRSERLACTANGMATLWDINREIDEPVFELDLHPAATTSVAIHPDDSYFITASDDGTARAILTFAIISQCTPLWSTKKDA